MSENKKHKHVTGGLQEKKVRVEPTKEEIKLDRKADKAKRKERAKERKKDRVSLWQRLKNVGGELRKVTWPTFAKTVAKTGVVLSVVAMFSLIVFGIDQGLGQLFRLLTRGMAE